MGSEVDEQFFSGEFLEVVPNEKLIYTWKITQLPGHPSFKPGQHWSHKNPTKVTVRFEKAGRGTKVILTHEGMEGHSEEYEMIEGGWEWILTKLLKFYLEHPRAEWDEYWNNLQKPWEEESSK